MPMTVWGIERWSRAEFRLGGIVQRGDLIDRSVDRSRLDPDDEVDRLPLRGGRLG